MNKLNNKGFSLVEILTALAISSILILGVSAFMNGGSVSYRTATTQTALQDDIQETLNYLNDLTQRATDVDFDEARKVFYIFMPKATSTTDEYELYYIMYNEADSKLYVHRTDVSTTNYDYRLTMFRKEDYYNENWLLATDVYKFNIEIERTPNLATPQPDGTPVYSRGAFEPSLVHIEVGFAKNNSDRDAAISVRPRNRSWTFPGDRLPNVLSFGGI